MAAWLTLDTDLDAALAQFVGGAASHLWAAVAAVGAVVVVAVLVKRLVRS